MMSDSEIAAVAKAVVTDAVADVVAELVEKAAAQRQQMWDTLTGLQAQLDQVTASRTVRVRDERVRVMVDGADLAQHHATFTDRPDRTRSVGGRDVRVFVDGREL